MPLYAFSPDKTIPQNVRSIAIDQLQYAQEQLQRTDNPEKGIYEARKCTKRLRALIRLVRRDMSPAAYMRDNITLREVANALGGLRDAWVRIETLDNLPDAAQFTAYISLRAAFVAEYDALSQAFMTGEQVPPLLHQLQTTENRARVWRINDHGFNTVRPNLLRTMRAGKDDYVVARDELSEFHIHEWRKRVKHLWYHLTLLREIAPEETVKLIAFLDTLGDLLGKAHDWAVMAELARQHLIETEHPLFFEALHAQQRLQEETALSMGHDFYYREFHTKPLLDALEKAWSQVAHGIPQREA